MPKSFCRGWSAHAILNFGTLLSCLWHGFLPPSWTGHDEVTLTDLDSMSLFEAFKQGLGKWRLTV